ncbi:MAG: hypothetical protein COB53_12510 [Elusimicrobia bacterium]|nr:MAG: hypothetical protein COB53_12510 [Elusimicrobiota bacterium]
MVVLRIILVVSLLAPLTAAAGAVPIMRLRQEAKTPDFTKAPVQNDFGSLVLHLGDTIMDKKLPTQRVPGVDLFLGGLEDALHAANDIPRGRILRNASGARESLRLAFNDLSAAGSKPHLKDIQKGLIAVAEDLEPLVLATEDSVRQLEAVAAAARAQVGAMVLVPPSSPGSKTPMYSLAAIVPLSPDIKKLRRRLRRYRKPLRKAKAYVRRARRRLTTINAFASQAENLDKNALRSLSQRRTRGIPTDYKTQMNSTKILKNANGYVERAVKGGEGVVAAMEDQLDPNFEQGLRWSVDRLLAADARIQLAKETMRQSAKRINFNHDVRLNKYIGYGWEITRGTPKEGWWIGRSNMAISEGRVDSGKIDEAYRQAAQAAAMARSASDAGMLSVKATTKTLGRFRDRPYRMPRRKLDAPALPQVRRARYRPKAEVPSKKLKVPKTFNVSMDEITDSYDGLRVQ